MNNKHQYFSGYLILKRVLDIVLSVLVLVLLLPFFLIVCVLILLDDPHGSPIFSQERIGLNGKVFTLFKFRTMCADAEAKRDALSGLNEADGPVFKIKNDPRITKVGRFLRKACIDEFPQFYNVLKGEMSIVGPRPALPKEVEKYSAYQKRRLSVKPGITCYWQIQPNRNEIPFNEWVELDLQYIKDRSLRTDVCICIRTVGAVFSMNGI